MSLEGVWAAVTQEESQVEGLQPAVMQRGLHEVGMFNPAMLSQIWQNKQGYWLGLCLQLAWAGCRTWHLWN